MRWIRSSRTKAVLAAVCVAALLAGTALAVTVTESSVPEEKQVGEPMDASANITDLYENDDSWRLVAETELENAEWTIEYYDQQGNLLNRSTPEGKTVTGNRTVEPPVDKIRIEVTGDTPPVEEYTFEGNESFQGLRIAKSVGGTDETIKSWTVRHFTTESREAREALTAAKRALDAANETGANVSGALSDFRNAKQAYTEGSFGVAQNLANQAERKANESRKAARTTAANGTDANASDGSQDGGSGGLPIVPIAIVLVVVVILAGGGFYFYSQGDQQETKLR